MLDFCFDSDSMFPKMSVFLVLSSNFDKNYLLSVGFNFIFVSQNQKQIVMQNKKRLYKHLIIIYILYFIVLVAGFMLKTIPNFTSGFDAGMALAERELDQGDTHSYYLAADVRNSSGYIEVEGLPENVETYLARLYVQVSDPGAFTLNNAFRVQADSGYAYLLLLVSGCSFLAVIVLIALMINSLRRSIRDEQPLRNSNIVRTRMIGILLIVQELANAFILHINQCKAVELLAGTQYEVLNRFPLNYWNLIIGMLFLFMAEVFAIGTQLSEDQKLTI